MSRRRSSSLRSNSNDRRSSDDRAICFRQGRHHRSFTFGPYQVCLTRNQHQRLFEGQEPQRIGCGVFACAYDHPWSSKRVVKLTRDAEDVSALITMQGKSSAIPKLYEAYRLRQQSESEDGDKTDVYAVVVERVNPIPQENRGWAERVLDALHKDVTKTKGRVTISPARRKFIKDNACVARNVREEPEARRVLDAMQTQLAKLRSKLERPSAGALTKGEIRREMRDVHAAAQAQLAKLAENKTCTRFVDEVANVSETLSQEGIRWSDMHTGNIGVGRDGTFKVIDLGITGRADRASEAELLRGLQQLAAAAKRVPKLLWYRRKPRRWTR